jgi:hypothetical protein
LSCGSPNRVFGQTARQFPSCSHLREPGILPGMSHERDENLRFAIELWTKDDQHVDEVLARCARIVIARAALKHYWIAQRLQRIRSAFSAGEKTKQVLLAAQWLFDSFTGALGSMRSRYLDGRWYASVRTCGPQVGRPD